MTLEKAITKAAGMDPSARQVAAVWRKSDDGMIYGLKFGSEIFHAIIQADGRNCRSIGVTGDTIRADLSLEDHYAADWTAGLLDVSETMRASRHVTLVPAGKAVYSLRQMMT